MTTTPKLRLLVCTLLVALVAAACGSDSKVGSEELLEGEATGENFLDTTTTTAAPAEGAAAQSTTTAPPTTAPPTTAAPTTAPPTTQQQVSIVITINADTATSQFDPRVARVFQGSIVRWTNNDSVPRSVKADDGSFSSGTIQPGGSFDFKADKPGSFNYSDGTRPYAVGSLEVVAR